MDYNVFFKNQLNHLKEEGSYRHFAALKRDAGHFPQANFYGDQANIQGEAIKDHPARKIKVWCSNDYLGMGQHPKLISTMQQVLGEQGAGAGGTRNISGTNIHHVALEAKLAKLHQKEAALIFTSGYVANYTTLSVLGRMIPDLIIFSDSMNHNSMIEGIRQSKGKRIVFKHNDLEDLEAKLSAYPLEAPKLIAYESVYSMDGDIGKIADIQALAKRYNALSFLDEVHAVGMYGKTGAGIAEQRGLGDQVDIVQGTMGKAFGVIGGYIAASAQLVDFVRSFGHGFIFTTALPPMIAAGACMSIDILSGAEGVNLRERHQERAASLKAKLRKHGFPLMDSECHIVPILVGDAVKCRQASDLLMDKHNIYVQPINHPTVQAGTERLRITPSPFHQDEDIEELIEALLATWQAIKLPRENPIENHDARNK